MDASLEVEVEPLHDLGERGERNCGSRPATTCACPVISVLVNSNTSLTTQQVKVYLSRKLPTTAGGEAIQISPERERSEPRRTHASAMN
jgi:hypothetical protein